MTSSTGLLKWVNLTAFIGVVVVNALANILPINGYTTGQLSEMYPNLFVPAGFTFSIWSLIYLLLAGFIIYQFTGKERADAGVRTIGWWFAASSLLNIFWILAWHYLQVALSLLVMLLLLLSLIRIYQRLDIGRSRPDRIPALFLHAPFSVYLGWITVATIANVTVFLVDLGFQGGGIPETVWAAAVIIVAAIITAGVLFTRKDVLYTLVIIWAYTGIIAKRTAAPPEDDGLIIWTAGLMAVFLLVGAVLAGVRRVKTASP